mmetsp:Transcript_74001/g.214379  ORF Transcript_74001/g.214379 Transcript_74001/m.214379 type:complete len:271 (-) Transcript_74001:1219-2031(-)
MCAMSSDNLAKACPLAMYFASFHASPKACARAQGAKRSDLAKARTSSREPPIAELTADVFCNQLRLLAKTSPTDLRHLGSSPYFCTAFIEVNWGKMSTRPTTSSHTRPNAARNSSFDGLRAMPPAFMSTDTENNFLGGSVGETASTRRLKDADAETSNSTNCAWNICSTITTQPPTRSSSSWAICMRRRFSAASFFACTMALLLSAAPACRSLKASRSVRSSVACRTPASIPSKISQSSSRLFSIFCCAPHSPEPMHVVCAWAKSASWTH